MPFFQGSHNFRIHGANFHDSPSSNGGQDQVGNSGSDGADYRGAQPFEHQPGYAGTGNMTQPGGYGPGQHFPPDNQQHHLVRAIQQGPDSNTYIASGHTSAQSSQSYLTSHLQPQGPDSAPATLMSFPQSSGWYPQLQPMHQPPSNPAAIGQFLFVPSPVPSPTTPGGVSMAYLTPSATTLEATAQIGGIPYGHPAPVPSHVTSTTAFEVATASQTQKAKKKKGVTFRVARLLSKLKVKKEKSRNVKDTVEQD